jgi:hypothetical protein
MGHGEKGGWKGGGGGGRSHPRRHSFDTAPGASGWSTEPHLVRHVREPLVGLGLAHKAVLDTAVGDAPAPHGNHMRHRWRCATDMNSPRPPTRNTATRDVNQHTHPRQQGPPSSVPYTPLSPFHAISQPAVPAVPPHSPPHDVFRVLERKP